MVVAVVGGTLVAREQALARALATLPESERGFRVDRFGLPLDQGAYETVDKQARRSLVALGGARTRRVIVFRELRVQGERVEIGAVDDLPEVVALRSGRLPRSCNENVCEVIQIGTGGRVRLHEGAVSLRRVGIARLHDPALFGEVSAATGGGATPPKLLLARDVQALQQLESLGSFYRVYSWVSPVRVDGLHTWDVGRLLAKESRAQAALAADSAFRLGGPDAALLDAQDRGDITANRLLLIGGETSALLLGFALIAALGLRAGLSNERRRLLARGARRWQTTLVTCSEVAALTIAGVLVGVGVGVVVASGIAQEAGLPASSAVSHAVATKTTLAALAGAWLTTTCLLVLATAMPAASNSRRVRLLDVAAVGAVAVVAVALSRGALDPVSASSGDTVLFLTLPALVSFVVAVALARLVAPAMRASERLTRSSSVSIRLAVLALARAPSRTIVSCTFIAVALGLALFAASYRSTLGRGAADQAAFEVPLDFTVTEGSRLVSPLEAAGLHRYRRLGGSSSAYPVLRLAATTPGRGAAVLSPTVIGVPPAAIAELRWRSDFSPLPSRTIANRLSAAGKPRLARLPLPPETKRLTFAARLRGSDVDLGLVVQRHDGGVDVLPLGEVRAGMKQFVADVRPDAVRSVLGIQLALPPGEQFFFAHRETESRAAQAPGGVLDLGPLTATLSRHRARLLTNWRDWSLAVGGRVTPHLNGAHLPFAFQETGSRLIFRPGGPIDRRAVPVIVSPDIARVAGIGGAITVSFQDFVVSGRIVGVARRMPTVPADESFILADQRWLTTAIAANAPGRGEPNEVWISSAYQQAAAAALRRAPFASLVVESRAEIERQLETDPLAHATAIALGAAAIVAVALALIGFWVAVASELRDERSDFFDLEAQGLEPERLRTQLRTRALILVVIGIAGGASLGALLSQLVVSLVQVSATTTVPEPPLRLDPAWRASGLAVVAVAAIALLIIEGSSRAAFRSARPQRTSWSLE